MPDTTLFVQVLQMVVAFGFLKELGNPRATRDYRIRFRVVVIILPLLALLGLRNLTHGGSGTLGAWIRYLAVFQCLFNFAVTGVLCLRYRLYMPKESGEKVTR